MKNEKWTEDLYLFRMKPAPPKKGDLQEYIALYCPEKDEKYLNSFSLLRAKDKHNHYANRAGKRYARAFCRFEASICFRYLQGIAKMR